MAVYSTNQNRQLYVAAGIESSLAAIQPEAKKGYVYVGTDKDGCKFINQNGYGGIVRSDLMKAVTIALNSNFNSGALVAGEDYILRVNFRQMYGMSDEDIYQKYGAVHATSSMQKNAFFRAMAYSLVKNFSRLYQPLVEVGLGTAVGTAKIVARATKDASGNIKLYEADGTEIAANSS